MARKKKSRARSGGEGSIRSLVSDVASSFKSEYIGTLGKDSDLVLAESWIPSSCHAVNFVCGDPVLGAFPQGRITELFGPKSSGKSLLLYDAGANCQKMGGIFMLVDSESAYHVDFGHSLGVDNETMIYAHIRTVEECFDKIEKTVLALRAKKFEGPILVGWDSVAATTTEKELGNDFEDGKVDFTKAKLMSAGMRKLGALAFRENVTFIITNQIRKKIGVMWGPNETRPGGEAVPFHASVCVEVRMGKKIRKKTKNTSGDRVGRVIGTNVSIHCEKNKVRPPFAKASLIIHLDRVKHRFEIDRWAGMLDLLVAERVILPAGKGKAGTYKLGSLTFTEDQLPDLWLEHIVPAIDTDYYTPLKEGEEVEDDVDTEEEEAEE